MAWTPYGAYLKHLGSAAWRAKRREVIDRCGGTCEGCHAAPVGHVHHLTYKRLGDELIEDLQGLCVPCHQLAHPDKAVGRPRKGPRVKEEGQTRKPPRDTLCPLCGRKFPDVQAVRAHSMAVHVYNLKNGKPGRRYRQKGTGKEPYAGPPVFL